MNAERLLALYDRIADAPDAISRLRQFILDLAVRGKLVPQDSTEERASVLLRRITAAKDKLMNEGTIRSTKSIKELTDADFPFEAPRSWIWIRLADISDVQDPNPSHRMPHYVTSGGAPFISSENFCDNDGINFTIGKRISLETLNDQLSRFPILPGAIGFTRIGTIGKTRFLPAERHYGISHAVCVINPVDPFAPDMKFLRLALSVEKILAFAHKGTRSIGVPDLGMAVIRSMTLPLPPLAEQHRIVQKVDALMALCDQLELARAEREAKRDRLATASLARLNAPDPDPSLFAAHARFALDNLTALAARPDQIKQIRQTILNLAVRGKLVPQDAMDEPASDWLRALATQRQGKKSKLNVPTPLQNLDTSYILPHSWCWMELGNLVTVMDAGWSPQCEGHPRSDASKWGVLKTTAVQTLAFDCGQNKELPSKFQPRPQHEAQIGDILVTRAGPKNRVGVSCVIDKTEPRLMISDKLIRFRLIDGLSPRFFALSLNAGVSSEALESAKSGMAVMQMNISQDKLRAVPVPLPPLAEQHRIVAKVDALMALCDQLEASLTAAETTRRRLLEALLAEALAPDRPVEAPYEHSKLAFC